MESVGGDSRAQPVERSGNDDRTDRRNGSAWSAVIGNERMTALAGAVLLVLLVIELVTAARLQTLLVAHVVAGVVLAGPLIVKLGSTGYRFVRYYTRSPVFVRRGPPHLALRLLAPLLIVATLVVVGSGIGLLVTGPSQAGFLVPLHGFSVLIFLPLLAIHVVAHLPPLPRLVAADVSNHAAAHVRGRTRRLVTNVGALVLGALAAILLLPTVTPWIPWTQTNGLIPAPVIVGGAAAILALLVTRPLGWGK